MGVQRSSEQDKTTLGSMTYSLGSIGALGPLPLGNGDDLELGPSETIGTEEMESPGGDESVEVDDIFKWTMTTLLRDEASTVG